MHGNMDYTTQDGKYSVVGFQTFLEFKVLVPKRMSQKVKTDTVRTSFEESGNNSQHLEM